MRKRGRRHSTLAVIPLGVKRHDYEIKARAGLFALSVGAANIDHLTSLYVLAELCEKGTDAPHIHTHAASVKRLCDEIHGANYDCNELRHIAMSASANVLLDYFARLQNATVAQMALKMGGQRSVNHAGARA